MTACAHLGATRIHFPDGTLATDLDLPSPPFPSLQSYDDISPSDVGFVRVEWPIKVKHKDKYLAHT